MSHGIAGFLDFSEHRVKLYEGNQRPLRSCRGEPRELYKPSWNPAGSPHLMLKKLGEEYIGKPYTW
jgi:hypothetical protein